MDPEFFILYKLTLRHQSEFSKYFLFLLSQVSHHQSFKALGSLQRRRICDTAKKNGDIGDFPMNFRTVE